MRNLLYYLIFIKQVDDRQVKVVPAEVVVLVPAQVVVLVPAEVAVEVQAVEVSHQTSTLIR